MSSTTAIPSYEQARARQRSEVADRQLTQQQIGIATIGLVAIT